MIALFLTLLLQVPVVQIEENDQELSRRDRQNPAVREEIPHEGVAKGDMDSHPKNRKEPLARDVRVLKPQKMWRSLPRATQARKNVSFKSGLSVVEYDVDASSLAKNSSVADPHHGKSSLRMLRGGSLHAIARKGNGGLFGARFPQPAVLAVKKKKKKLHTDTSGIKDKKKSQRTRKN